jgi:hypothetical protein|tara:strand:+ start:375 stop:527 length:153 start_codon:yes stop_codon:yes gene_type:complete
MDEATGFKGEIGRKKAENKQRKRDALTAKEKRDRKLQDLVSSPSKWRNLR